jgi:2-polyprenyl-3-methyl-5-hydroxy-6-metoxy-1,4-benzoquinol methylase
MGRCDLCGGAGRIPVATVTRFDPPLDIVRCTNCGLIRQYPIPSAERLEGLYGADYYAYAEFRYGDERGNEAQVRIQYAARLRAIEEHLGLGGPPMAAGLPATGSHRLLDVGSSFGLFLDEARKRGWDVQGVDVSETAAKYAIDALGIPVSATTLRDARLPAASFDAITMIEVIEHMPDPLEQVTEAARLLVPGGLLVIQTADADSLKARLSGSDWEYYLPGHIHYFTRDTLASLVREAGLVPERLYHGDEMGVLAKWRKEMVLEGPRLIRAWRAAAASVKHLARRVSVGGVSLGGMVMYARRPQQPDS